jgi:Di-haem oxidoreductase, putative peroxidase
MKAPVVVGLLLSVAVCASAVSAHEPHVCPAGINDTPALPAHLHQKDVLKMHLSEVFAAGQRLFVTDFNVCDGAGRPGMNGGVTPRTVDPEHGPRFTPVSAPDSDSCAGCHNQPQPGGAGDFVANVFVLAQNQIPVASNVLNPDFSQAFPERNTLGMFGSGAIELLGREMTADLLKLRAQAIADAAAGHAVAVELITKGVSFGSLTAYPDGSVDTSAVEGVDSDLIIKPFSRKGAMRSVREFSVNAFSQHHGMQAVERFGRDTDPDQDGITNELTIGDMTAASVFQEALPVPVSVKWHPDHKMMGRGERLFSEVGCAGCHISELPLNTTVFCDPDPMNPGSGPFKTFNDTSHSFCFDLRKTGLRDGMVRAYSDLKRHVICDANKPHYCNEPASPLQPADNTEPIPRDQFLTAKLWDVGNSAPFGHRGDLDTIFASIVAHGGEATASEANFEALPDSDQSAIVAFLKTLVMPIIKNKDPNPQQAGSPPF